MPLNDGEVVPIVMLRREGAAMALPVPLAFTPAEVITLLGTVCALAEPGWHDHTEWCVIMATDTRFASWPDPEPWAVAPDP